MQITITLGNEYARSAEYYLQKRYNSKAKLGKLIKVAITREVSAQAKEEFVQIEHDSAEYKGGDK